MSIHPKCVSFFFFKILVYISGRFKTFALISEQRECGLKTEIASVCGPKEPPVGHPGVHPATKAVVT